MGGTGDAVGAALLLSYIMLGSTPTQRGWGMAAAAAAPLRANGQPNVFREFAA